MIIITGEAEIDAARMDDALPHMKSMMAVSRAESGCLAYALLADPLKPGVISITERWTGEDALKAHFTTPHMAEFNKVLGGFGVKRLDVKLYDAINERDLKL